MVRYRTRYAQNVPYARYQDVGTCPKTRNDSRLIRALERVAIVAAAGEHFLKWEYHGPVSPISGPSGGKSE